MARTLRKTKGNGKGAAPPFVMLDRAMLSSPGFRALSFAAQAVLLQLMAQYNGRNNGDLSATRTMAKEWGIASDNTLRRALSELEEGGWILQTRSSVFSRDGARCALYAVGWLPIHECPGKDLEVEPTRAPPRPLPTLFRSNSSGAETAHSKAQKLRTVGA